MNPEQLTSMIAKPYRHVAEFGYDFCNGLLLAWVSSGFDAQLEFDVETDRGADRWALWWINGGRNNFPGISSEVDRTILRVMHLDYLDSHPASLGLPITPLLSLVYRNRSDLRELFDVRVPDGIDQLWFWWVYSGREQYFKEHLRQADWLIEAELRSLHQLDARSFERTGLASPTTLVRIFSPTTAGLSGTGPVRDSDAWNDFFARKDLLLKLPNGGQPYIANGFSDQKNQKELIFGGIFSETFALVYSMRLDLQQAYDTRTSDGLTGLLFWWLNSGRREYPDVQQVNDEKILRSLHLQYLHGRKDDERKELTPLLSMIWHRREDLRAAFDIKIADGIIQMWRWWFVNGRREYFGPVDLSLEPELQALLPLNQNSPNGLASSCTIDPSSREAPGICLVGYPKGEFGLGEDVRMLRAALDHAKISSVIINAPWEITARQAIKEQSIEASIANFGCDVMFYVMPPFDTVTLLNTIGPRAFSARRKIGFWQWELEHFPHQAKLAMELVDEIWCHSEHSAKAFQAATDKPVIKVPLPVFVPVQHVKSRASFDLPDRAFLVFTSLDGASTIARKNPLAAILSFQQAFPKGREQARLIVKAMNTKNDSLWRECLRKAADDDRIIIIDEVMDRSDYFDLMQNCDAVLSLHRAEGFGRLMAEAMAFGIPVIATRYSGNLDFMTDENSWLVEGNLVPVLRGDYAFHQGQRWLEPSLADAARALRECAADKPARQRRAALAKDNISSAYGLDACGRVYQKLLHAGPAGSS
jgi:glycosyltransferase involved in cell wall biosynthesis